MKSLFLTQEGENVKNRIQSWTSSNISNYKIPLVRLTSSLKQLMYYSIRGFEIYGFDFSEFWDNHECHDIFLYNNHINTIVRRLQTKDDYWYGRTGIMINHKSRNMTVDNCLIHNIGRLSGQYDTEQFSHNYKHDHGIYGQGYNIRIINNLIYDFPDGWYIKVNGSDFGISEVVI